jgi:hypothetical protein
MVLLVFTEMLGFDLYDMLATRSIFPGVTHYATTRPQSFVFVIEQNRYFTITLRTGAYSGSQLLHSYFG